MVVEPSRASAAELEIGKWGLEGPPEYQELEATAEQDSSWWPEAEEDAKRYRFFAVRNPVHAPKVVPLMQQAERAYEIHRSRGGLETAEGFRSFLQGNYPFIAAEFRDIAPVLYFDFRGAAKHEYVLDEIMVEVIDYSEYRGGGYSDKSAWYDILLNPEPGTYSYPVDQSLRFTGSGRAELRFFSDNFYAFSGLSPMGAYVIEISFVFRVDGSENFVVSTGAFKIDV